MKLNYLLIIIIVATISSISQSTENFIGGHVDSTSFYISTADVKNKQGIMKAVQDQNENDNENDNKNENENENENESENENENENDETNGKETQKDVGDEDQETSKGHRYLHPSESRFWINILIAAFLTCVGGFCSGMTVGLMSIEKIQLEIMSMSKDAQERKIAKKILSVVSDHHLFLVALLVANAMALETLPLIVHSLMPDWAAIIFSTIIVLVIAEIVPQAICTGPKKITLAYYASPIILVLIKVLYIVVYPIARGLDSLLGKHEHQRIQHKDFANFLGGSQNLKSTQKLLLTSILQLRTERVPQIMTTLDDLYMLSMEDRLTSSKIAEINKKDYSYILVYKDKNRTKIMGVIKTKEFSLQYLKKMNEQNGINKNKVFRVGDFFIGDHSILSVYEDTNLLEMLMLFQAKSFRFALVIGKKRKVWPGIQSIMYSKSDMIAAKEQGQVMGIVFLYRIFEEIAQYNQQIATNTVRVIQNHNNIEMKEIKTELKEPLLEQ